MQSRHHRRLAPTAVSVAKLKSPLVARKSPPHTGDGVCAAFASPKSAVDAAVAVQRALELPVRMGIATGEAELRDGDYFGAVRFGLLSAIQTRLRRHRGARR